MTEEELRVRLERIEAALRLIARTTNPTFPFLALSGNDLVQSVDKILKGESLNEFVSLDGR